MPCNLNYDCKTDDVAQVREEPVPQKIQKRRHRKILSTYRFSAIADVRQSTAHPNMSAASSVANARLFVAKTSTTRRTSSRRSSVRVMASVAPSIIVGGGRVGQALADMGVPGDVIMKRGDAFPADAASALSSGQEPRPQWTFY